MKVGKWTLKYYNVLDSTQKFLIDRIKDSGTDVPVCIWTDMQTAGIGSRGNEWIGKKGNLFFSFSDKAENYSDVPMQSLSIYFGWIFKKTLNSLGSKCIMKWPNDIYVIEKKPLKIGGVITSLTSGYVICGIGLNTAFAPSDGFGCLDIEVKNDKILKSFFSELDKNISWNSVITEFEEEFENYKKLFSYDGSLALDGSIENNQKRIYSKR